MTKKKKEPSPKQLAKKFSDADAKAGKHSEYFLKHAQKIGVSKDQRVQMFHALRAMWLHGYVTGHTDATEEADEQQYERSVRDALKMQRDGS